MMPKFSKVLISMSRYVLVCAQVHMFGVFKKFKQMFG